jgi:hypothetical protein
MIRRLHERLGISAEVLIRPEKRGMNDNRAGRLPKLYGTVPDVELDAEEPVRLPACIEQHPPPTADKRMPKPSRSWSAFSAARAGTSTVTFTPVLPQPLCARP